MRRSAILVAGLMGMALPGATAVSAQDFQESGVLAAGAGAVNGSEAGSWIERGSLMINDANYRGALDQLGQALRESTAEDDRSSALLRQALAALYVPGSEALELTERYLAEYPACAQRERLLVAVADLRYDAGEYGKALEAYRQVNLSALSNLAAARVTYHTAFCELRIGHTDTAKRLFESLAGTAYAMEGRFYEGYIAYLGENWQEARRLFDSVDRKGMPTVMADYYLCQIDYRQQRYAQAAREAEAILRSGVSLNQEYNAEATRIAGESLYREGDEKKGVSLLRQYVGMCAQPQLSALYILGVEDFRDGNWEKAIERLAPVTADDSTIGQSAYLYIGQSYLKLDNNNAATVALDKACRLNHDPEVTEMALYNLAVAKAQGGSVPFGSSVELFEEFLQRYPDSKYAPAVADYVVEGYMTDNNYQAALNAIEKIRRPDARVLAAKQRVLYGLGMRELQGGLAEKAASHLKAASEMGKYDSALAAEATLWLGESLYQTGDYNGAAKAFNAYLRQSNGTPANRALAYYDLGYARYQLKQHNLAESDFEKFIKQTPDKANSTLMADAYNRLGDCQYYARKFSQAATTYGNAYDADPRRGDYPSFQQGLMKGLQRDYQGKIDDLAEMMREFPSSTLIPTALLETAESYVELGRRDRAIETYTLLSSRYPNSPQGRQGQLLLAITYLNAGDKQTAINQYKKVISRYPTSQEAQVASDDLKQLYADMGRVNEYVEFINNVPQAPKPENSELAALTLQSAESALENGQQQKALALATEVVNNYPDSPQAIHALAIKGKVEYEQGHATEALTTYKLLEERAADADEINEARFGILRVSRDLGENEQAIKMADRLLASTDLPTDGRKEAEFLKSLALRDLGRGNEAVAIWKEMSVDTDDLHGAKSAYYMALYQFDNGDLKSAKKSVNALIEANPPHDYWLAKSFILLSDILRKEGNSFEADEYLRSLKENYPGQESDIFREIDQRLK